MADDLTALLRRTAEPLVPSYVLDLLAARLAEVVEKWYADLESDSDTGLVLGMQIARARKSEADAVALLRELVSNAPDHLIARCLVCGGHGRNHADWCPLVKARANLARQKEHPHA